MKTISVLSFAIPMILQLGILALLIGKRLRQRFQWFFIYVLFDFFNAIIRLIVSTNRDVYFAVYWSTTVLVVVLTFTAFRECFLNVLCPFTQTDWFRWLFWISIGLAATYSIVKAALQPSAKTSLLVAISLQGEQTFEYIVMAAALLYFGMYFVLVRVPEIKDFKYESGVILGFFATVALSNLGVLTRSVFGTRFYTISKWLPALAYIIGQAVWLQTFLRTEPKVITTTVPPIELTPDQMMSDLNRYPQLIAKMRTWLRRK